MTHLERFKAFYKTPSLWNDQLCGIKSFRLADFEFNHLRLDETITLPVIPAGTLLGKRAEYFFKFCIEQSTNYDLLVHNLQVFNGKITLGELDYIVEHTTTKRQIHIELVYKFYLYDPLSQTQSNVVKEPFATQFSHYIGPNRRDNFMYKLERLLTHQLPLLHHPQTAAALDSLGLNSKKMEQQVCFLAHVFIPQALWQHDFKYINKRCIVGYYVGNSAFAEANTPYTYHLPEKYAWKMTPHSQNDRLTHHQACVLITESLQRGFAPLVWMQLPDNTWERFFVVQDAHAYNP